MTRSKAMEFQMPVKTYFGTGVVWQHRQAMKGLGQKALLVTGKNSAKRSGAYQAMIQSLDDLGTAYVLFDEIEENPSAATVLRAAEFGRSEGVDFVIGIGGGSPMDGAKAIAMCIVNPSLTEATLFGQPPLAAVPVVAVPTTSGTGSEVTPYAILTDHLDQSKKNLGQSIYPKVAYLDPRFTDSLSPEVTRHTAVDAFTHLAEGFLNTNASAVSDALAIRGFKVFGRCLSALDEGQISQGLREDLMLASMLAGMVIAQTGTSLPHGLGYALTYHHGLPHGLANGLVFSAYLEVFKDKTKLSEMLAALGLGRLEDLTRLLDKWNQTEAFPSEEMLRVYARQMAGNAAKLKNHPEPVTEEQLFEIYRKSFDKLTLCK